METARPSGVMTIFSPAEDQGFVRPDGDILSAAALVSEGKIRRHFVSERRNEDTDLQGLAKESLSAQKSRWTRIRPSHVSSDPVDLKVPVGSPEAVVSGTATRSRGSTLM